MPRVIPTLVRVENAALGYRTTQQTRLQSMRMSTVVEERGGLGYAVCHMTPRAVVEAQFATALVGDSASSDVNKEGVD